MTAPVEEDIVLKFIHTADWHLGRKFPSFSKEQGEKLTRARLDVLDRILASAERHRVDAVLCAGDLFDDTAPEAEWWRQVAERFAAKHDWTNLPVFLLPGNHDPLLPSSVWAQGSPFRKLLPPWVHVVDRDLFEYELPNNAVLYAVPCKSKAGQVDPTGMIPCRADGDERIRIGLVHGSTFDVKDCQTNFPISAQAAVDRGLDYLAIGDTHGFRRVPPEREQPPTIYPGAPEATAFDEKLPGNVAVVMMTRQRRAIVKAERVAFWTWEEHKITSLAQLEALVERTDLRDKVLRITCEMTLPAPDYEAAENMLDALGGTEARHPLAGVLQLHRHGLRLETSNVDEFCTDLPDTLMSAVRRLKERATLPGEALAAQRALFHLYRISRRRAS